MSQLLQWLPLYTTDWLVAQAASEPSWVTALSQLDVGKLAVLMVFGTGMIGAIGYGVTSAIRACNGVPDGTDALNARIGALEQRIQELESKSNRP